jgi:WD40 repeat protein
VAAGADGLVRLFAVTDGRLVTGNAEQGGGDTSSLAFEPASNVLAAGGSDGKLRMFRVGAGKLTLLHSTAADSGGDELGKGVAALAFDPRGTTLAAGSGDGMVRLFAVSHGTPSLRTSVSAASGGDGGVSGIAFEAEGSTLVASSGGASVRLFAVSRGKLSLAETAEPAGADAGLINLASAPETGTIALYDGQPVLVAVSHRKVALLQAVAPVATAGPDEAAALADGGGMLAVAADDDTLLYRISHGTAGLRSSAPTTKGDSLAFAPNGMTLAVGTSDGGTVLFAVSGGTLTELLKVPASGLISTVDFSPDGTELAVGGDLGVQLLDVVWPNIAYLRARVCGLVWRNLSRSEWSSVAPPGLQNPNACPG